MNLNSFILGFEKTAEELVKLAESMGGMPNRTGTTRPPAFNRPNSFFPKGPSTTPASQPNMGGMFGIRAPRIGGGGISNPGNAGIKPMIDWGAGIRGGISNPGNAGIKPRFDWGAGIRGGISNPPNYSGNSSTNGNSPIKPMIDWATRQGGMAIGDHVVERGAQKLTGMRPSRFSLKGGILGGVVGWGADKVIDKGLDAVGWKNNPAAEQGRGTYGQMAGQNFRNTARDIGSGAAGGFATGGIPGAVMGGITGGVSNIAGMARTGYQDAKELINMRGGNDRDTLKQQRILSDRLNANKLRNANRDSNALNSLITQNTPAQPSPVPSAQPITPRSVTPNPPTTPTVAPRPITPNPATTPVERG